MYAFSWSCYYGSDRMYVCNSCTFLSAFPQVLLLHTHVCVSLSSDPKCYACGSVTSFRLYAFFFSFSLERVHTLTQVLLHKFAAGLSPLIHSFRRFFFVCSGVIMRFNSFFAFLSFGFFSPFSPFHHHSLYSIKYICTHTHTRRCYMPKNLFLADAVARIKNHHLQMLKKNVLIYWYLDTKSIKNEKKIFLYFKQTQIILFYRFLCLKKESRSESLLFNIQFVFRKENV